MNTPLIIEHVPVAELPSEWRVKLRAMPSTHVTVRIEEESGTSAGALTNNPLFGLWRDRDDMADVDAYLRRVRSPRHFSGLPGKDD